jgi:hypothetical protein
MSERTQEQQKQLMHLSARYGYAYDDVEAALSVITENNSAVAIPAATTFEQQDVLVEYVNDGLEAGV